MFHTDSTYIGHEKIILEKWEKLGLNDLINQLEEQFEESFNFMDGPPFVSSGSLHLGSLSISFFKDIIVRFERQHRKKCFNKMGFDCHGLPSENMVMKLLDLNSNADIEKYGVGKFIDKCIETIHSYSNSWKPTFDKIGRQIDFKNQYKTIDTSFMETVWNVFKQIFEKNLVYKAFKVMPYSYACETPLSNFEAGLNYKSVQTNTVYVKFQLKYESNVYFIVWTTTPWTLPSNIALCVSPSIEYVRCVTKNGEIYILSKNCVKNLKIEFVSIDDIGLGSNLKNIEYEPLFDYMKFKYHKVLVDSYVQDNQEIGTGIVHQSPSHGVDDCRVCIENNVITSKELEKTCLVNAQGQFIENMGELTGQIVFDTNKTIINMLKTQNMLVLTQNYVHQYPHCYRTDKPLIYKIVSSYFIAVSQIKEKLLEMNDKVNWTKYEIGHKRFRNWIENPVDWCISRNRYFGTPIPIWETDDGSEKIVIGSIDELVEKAKLSYRPTDLHYNNICDIVIISNSGKQMRCQKDCFDCWFESGSVPFGQHHFPFENSSFFDEKEFLCDFVCEGLDQTRGWFYTLLVISTIIMDKPPFKNVMCTGLILDKNGQKLSKRNGNFVDPNELIDKYGADIIRLYLSSSQLVNGEPLLFNEEEISNMCKRIIPFINVVNFYSEQRMKQFDKDIFDHLEYITNDSDFATDDVTDMWILTKLSNLKNNVESLMEQFRIDVVVGQIIAFIEDITNWYVKISRDRLKNNCSYKDYIQSMSVLFTVLYNYTLIIAPFMPFLAEHIYQYLSKDFMIVYVNRLSNSKNFDKLQFQKSVHLCHYPINNKVYPETSFEQLKQIVIALRQIRSKSKSHESLRTPIKKCTIYHHEQKYLDNIKDVIELVYDETNCLEYNYCIMDDTMYLLKPKVNIKSLGQKFKKDANNIKNKIENLNQDELKLFVEQKQITIESYTLNENDFVVSKELNIPLQKNDISFIHNDLMLIIDLTYDNDVHELGNIKTIITRIQQHRKLLGLKPWNTINVYYDKKCYLMEKYQDYITAKIKTNFIWNDKYTENKKEYVYIDFIGKEEKINFFIEIL
ncbi:isoleucyl-tRNA synthetase [Bodo saltans virus]|uniref:isoleucine--tRNA ligase n=1 Tax=Bodo saltans virus TaxID=2024608 RepID=A0A2H4UVG0_9VIRU|nr:isoleucyl-tRNA synthetase [Bodo saltans virus]ATZ80901.1 isoleucyl-tRNA synthetase [Bodo saltans virus]